MSEEQVAALRAKLKDEELQNKLEGAANLYAAVSSVGPVGVAELIDAARDLYEEDRLLGAETLTALENAISSYETSVIDHTYIPLKRKMKEYKETIKLLLLS